MAGTSDLILVANEIRDLGPGIGRGLFAAEWIPVGTLVAVCGGQPMISDDFVHLDHELQAKSIQVADNVFLVPGDLSSPVCLINHSCEPSLRLAGDITLVAARDIAVGESLTYDYATSDSAAYDEFECLCGSPGCRQKVTSDDWLRPEIQERYDGWFSPYLQRQVDAMRAAGPGFDGDLVSY